MAFGGIHEFMKWPRSVLTDSGGFQVFSLARHMRISEEGADLRSYVDGKKILLTPELSIETQKAIGSDIMMVLDQCIPSLADKSQAKAALDLTFAWAKRSLAARGDSKQALFGIVQGASFLDLRKESADQITSLPFDGYAIGGVAVGDDRDRRDDVIAYTANLLPRNTPRYLMGVGTPSDLLEAVARGMDMFDCILPTALAQQGVCFTRDGKFDLKRAVNRFSKEPIDAECSCSTCRTYTRGYLHHLIKAGETMGGTLAGIHNLTYYYELMTSMRNSIVQDSFQNFYDVTKERWRTYESQTDRSPQPQSKRGNRLPRSIGNYEVFDRGDFASIRHTPSGEIMHSVSDPLEEATRLYVEQSRLKDRILENSESPLVIWDVGLGAATNAMATIATYEGVASNASSVSPLELISFENDLDSLKLTLLYPNLFAHVRHGAPHGIAESGNWRSPRSNLSWRLMEGDFCDLMHEASTPDIIYFDPFSYKTDSPLWSLEVFEKIFSVSKPGTVLFTYSASTAIRSCLLGAGFDVARGVGTGPKLETTIAIVPGTSSSDHFDLLGKEWLGRWDRSQSQVPETMSEEAAEDLRSRVRSHRQFAK